MAAPEVTVVIPAFNRAGVIGRAVASALAQEDSDIEVVVVDDGSTDGTREVVAAIRDPRLRIISFPQNRGGAAARNAGVAAASGTFIAFLDSDDYWRPRKLIDQLLLARQQQSGNFVIYNAAVWLEKGADYVVPARAFDPAEDNLSTYMIYEHNLMQTSGLLLPRELASRVPFDERLRRHQDYDLVLALHRQGVRFLLCDKANVIWTFEDGGNRISAEPNVGPSVAWLKSRWALLSWPARAEFAAVMIGRKLVKSRPLAGAMFILAGIAFYPPILARAIAKVRRLAVAG